MKENSHCEVWKFFYILSVIKKMVKKMKKSYAVILAAGSGTRMGGNIAKQYRILGENPVLYYSVRAFEESPVNSIVLVVTDGMQDYVRKEIVERYNFSKVEAVVVGGNERYKSVYKGLEVLSEEGIVLIHDGARPFVDNALIGRVLKKMETEQACVPAVPLKDTVKRALNGYIQQTIPREELYAVQTPQAFDLGVLKLSYKEYFRFLNGLEQKKEYKSLANRTVTDDAMLVEAMLGTQVAVVEGDYRNIKLTTPEDWIIAKAFLKVM